MELKARSAGPRRLSRAAYGSDIVVEVLRDLGIPYVPLNPGSSFRGIHDSLVNLAPAASPQIVVCTHEEVAVAAGQGYARVTDEPLVVAVHNVVGLLHATMAIYNAWCDRLPMVVIGGTGPIDARKRRPHIDWVHTAAVQGNAVRDFVKWDDQPASLEAIPDSLLKAYRIAMTEPKGPVYVNFDVELQERQVEDGFVLPDVARYRPPAPVAANPEALERAARLLAGATWPVILVDDVRHPDALAALETLAELLGAGVVSTGARYALPTNHPLNLSANRVAALEDADLVLAVDVFDLDAALASDRRPAGSGRHAVRHGTRVIAVGTDDLLERSWTTDRGAAYPVDLPVTANSGLALPALVELCRTAVDKGQADRSAIEQRRTAVRRLHDASLEQRRAAAARVWNNRPVPLDRLYGELWQALPGSRWSIAHSGYNRAAASLIEFSEPLQQAGGGWRGGGLGQGAGAPIGAALALRDEERVCISVVGDGDLLVNPSALWTVANLKLPLLTVVNNNRAYGNDEGHQDYMARSRGRPVENRGVGIYLEEPPADFATMARSFGVEGLPRVDDPAELGRTLARGVEIVARERRPVLVEVVTQRMDR